MIIRRRRTFLIKAVSLLSFLAIVDYLVVTDLVNIGVTALSIEEYYFSSSLVAGLLAEEYYFTTLFLVLLSYFKDYKRYRRERDFMAIERRGTFFTKLALLQFFLVIVNLVISAEEYHFTTLFSVLLSYSKDYKRYSQLVSYFVYHACSTIESYLIKHSVNYSASRTLREHCEEEMQY